MFTWYGDLIAALVVSLLAIGAAFLVILLPFIVSKIKNDGG